MADVRRQGRLVADDLGPGVKTSNVEPHGTHAAAATRGSRSTNLAGSKGMIWRDASTESVGQIRDMTVYGAEFVDNDDGTGQLIIGGGAGEGGEDPGISSGSPVSMYNNSGQDLQTGTVVVVDDTHDRAVTLTTTPGSTLIAGVVQEPIAAEGTGLVLFNGYAAEVRSVYPVARGEYLQTSATAGEGQGTASRASGSFGVYLAAANMTQLLDTVATTEQETPDNELVITMPDDLEVGRVMLLALYIDLALVAEAVTLTGWTRIGSTNGFRYYTKVSNGADTATAQWTTNSPAAAIVVQFDERVNAADIVEDFNYQSTTSAASVSGLSAAPRFAIAGVQAAAAEPAGWTLLGATAVLASGGGAPTDLAQAGTATNDPANNVTWNNPTNINDGDDTTAATVPFHGGGSTFRIKLDLGSAQNVAEAWVRTVYAMDLHYSTDDVTYLSPPSVSWTGPLSHNGTPDWYRITWTGGVINARYWRVGRTSAGIGGIEGIDTLELLGTTDASAAGTLVGKFIGTDAAVTSPFSGTGNEYDAVFALNLNDDVLPSALLYGPDLLGVADSTGPDAAFIWKPLMSFDGTSWHVVTGATGNPIMSFGPL